MQPPGFMLRRATVDDLPALKELWGRAGLPVVEEERHLTEFQLMFSQEGELLGAAGLHIVGKHGRLHSEAFSHPEHEEALRPHLWERLRGVARNHGLARLWIQETAPFWRQEAGFAPAGEDLLKKLPPAFGDRHSAWQTASLREDSMEAASLEKEFELFQQSQQQSTEQVLRQARQLKVLAYIILVLALAGAGYVVLRLVQRGPNVIEMLRR